MNQLKLLIIDDEPGILMFMEKIYTKKGYTVFTCLDGLSAVETFKKERPQITFMEILMFYSPIDGLEVLRRIKEIDKDAYCIMVTRVDDPDSIKRAKELGALHYINKPFEIEDIDVCIEEVEELLSKPAPASIKETDVKKPKSWQSFYQKLKSLLGRFSINRS